MFKGLFDNVSKLSLKELNMIMAQTVRTNVSNIVHLNINKTNLDKFIKEVTYTVCKNEVENGSVVNFLGGMFAATISMVVNQQKTEKEKDEKDPLTVLMIQYPMVVKMGEKFLFTCGFLCEVKSVMDELLKKYENVTTETK